MPLKEDLKINLVSSFTQQEQNDALLHVFDYLLIKLPEELKTKKLIKQAVEKSN